MGHTIQQVGAKKELFRDVDLCAILGLIIDEVSRDSTRYSTLSKHHEHWRSFTRTCGAGIIDLKLASIAEAEPTRKQFLDLLDRVSEEVRRKGPTIDIDKRRREWGIRGVRFGLYDATDLLQMISRIRTLVED